MTNTTGKTPRSNKTRTTAADSPIHQATGEVPAENKRGDFTPADIASLLGCKATFVRRVLRPHFKDSHILRNKWTFEKDSPECLEAIAVVRQALNSKNAE